MQQPLPCQDNVLLTYNENYDNISSATVHHHFNIVAILIHQAILIILIPNMHILRKYLISLRFVVYSTTTSGFSFAKA